MSILMRHSEEGEMLERRAGGQTKGLLLKVSSLGAALRVTCMVAGKREWVPAPPPHLSWGRQFFSSC